MKMKITDFVLVFAFACATLFSVGCGGNNGGGNNQDPNRGFFVSVTAGGIPTVAKVDGQFIGGSGNFGSMNTFNLTTFGAGFTQAPNTRVPGTWRMTYGPQPGMPSLCLGYLTTDRNVSLGSMETLPCMPRFFSFTASPDTIDATNPPATVMFSGKGIDSLYGTPMLAFYNEFGRIAVTTPADEMLYGGGQTSGVLVSVPDLTLAYDGTYTVALHNINQDGSWELIGAAPITIYGNPAPPFDDDGGGNGCNQSYSQPQLPCD